MSNDDATVARTDAKAQGEWWGGDIPVAQLDEFIQRSKQLGWEPVLDEVAVKRKQFAHRLRNFRAGNWHLLRALPTECKALDLGCGFGALALGLSRYYRFVIGVDALWTRVSYGSLRAQQEKREDIRFVEAGGFALPFKGATFDLVTMNGVLEWAALYAEGAPRDLQVSMLREVRRTLSDRGTIAVAIENRYALETLVGMDDTHTGMRLVPALPRPLANVVSRTLRRKPYRTYLYDIAGYRQLFKDAGYREVKVVDLVSSYNDYDFVVMPNDHITYRFLWKKNLVRSFYGRAGKVRKFLSSTVASSLGDLAYSYLILAGNDVVTLLDSEHPIWKANVARGIPVGARRFACQGVVAGSLAIIAHDGARTLGALEFIGAKQSNGGTVLDDSVAAGLHLGAPTTDWSDFRGLRVRARAAGTWS